MRLADPRVESPVLSIIEKYVTGLKEYSDALRADLAEIRAERKKAAGFPTASRSTKKDEASQARLLEAPASGRREGRRPYVQDNTQDQVPPVHLLARHTVFRSIAEEAAEFYNQGALADMNITLDRFPVGTGPYMMDTNNPNMEIVLTRNRTSITRNTLPKATVETAGVDFSSTLAQSSHSWKK
jgi:hypothetical protein